MPNQQYTKQTLNRHARILASHRHHALNKPFAASKSLRPSGNPGTFWSHKQAKATNKHVKKIK